MERLRGFGLSDASYVGAPAVRIPYFDADGNLAATRFRVRLEKAPGGNGRFYWKRGAKPCLYGLDRLGLARERGYVALVEGESDCHTLWHHGEPAVGVPGAANWNEARDAAELDGVVRVYVVVEADQGGSAVREWLATSAIRDRVFLLDLGAHKDPSGLHLADPAQFPERWRAALAAAIPWADAADQSAREGAKAAEAGCAVLDAAHAFLGRFVANPSGHARVAHALWVAHAHLMDAWESTPRLAFLSPEPASGKTWALEVTELLVLNPVEAVNVTPAYLFRKVGGWDGRPTILYDEIDTVFGPKAKDNEEIRGLLNAGHRVGAVAGRCVVRGKMVETEEIPAYCAVAMAGLGGLPDTILTRSVIVRMRRRAPDERVEAYRRRVHAPDGHKIRDRLAAWANAVREDVGQAWPELPAGIEDRDGDVWEPLIAVADAAGGDWPRRARVAAVALVADSKESTPSLGIRLLADLRAVFGEADAMATGSILSALHGLDEAPWAELVGGKPLNARGLARRLAEYGVTSKNVRLGGSVQKGYARADLVDAWSRYLPSPPQESATSATSATNARVAAPPDVPPPNEGPDPARDARSAPDGGRVCGECGEVLPAGWTALYCLRHGAPSSPPGSPQRSLVAPVTEAPSLAGSGHPDGCAICGAALPPGGRYLCGGCAAHRAAD